MRRIPFMLILLLLISLPLHAQENATLRVGHYFITDGFDPHAQRSDGRLVSFDPIFDALVKLDAAGSTLPGLATDWAVTPERITFTLLEDVVFSDGTPFDAAAAAANLNRARTEGSGPVQQELAPIESVEAVDAVTLRLNMAQEDPFILQRLAGYPGMMISPNAFDTVTREPVGTGPFVLDLDDTIIGAFHAYNRNERYRDPGAIALDRIEVRVGSGADGINALLGGEHDVAFVSAELSAQLAAVDVVVYNTRAVLYAINILDREGTLIPELADQNVRCALNYAIDREAYAFSVGGVAVEPLSTIIPDDWYGYAEDTITYDYDVARARALLAAAGVEALTIPSVTSPTFQVRHEAAMGFMPAIGITVNTDLVPVPEVIATIYGGEYPLSYVSIEPEHFTIFVQQHILADAPFNTFGAVDADIEALAAAALTLPLDEAEPLWQEINQLINERCYFIPLTIGSLAVAAQPYVENVETRFRTNGFIYLRDLALNR
ncbi:MAG: hypothetical protein GYB67_07295 [Chloroflexi bacterium]|nr:hypothetical protein [Chloroflexota bacterium]